MSSNRTGEQEPRIRVEPDRRFTDGGDAAELVSAYGMVPDEWQRSILDAWLGRDQFDKFTATTCGLSVPRQNGKNAVVEMYELYHLTCIGSAILHTAHEVKTARKSFLRLAGFFENPAYPELCEMVVQIRRTNGQEAITLQNGGSIEFSARSKGSARGFTVDCVVFDEAAFLTDEQQDAIMSTMAAAPLGNRQMVYTGTPPGPSMPCEVFGRVRSDALRNADSRLAWHEWSVEEMPKAELFAEVVDACYMTNPALGIRLDEGFTETEFHRLSQDGFARERLGWWATGSAAALISRKQWESLEVDGPPKGKRAFGVKFSPDGAVVALAVAVKPAKDTDALPYVQIIRYESMREGTSWLARWLLDAKDVTACAVIDGRSHADPLVAQMREGGYPRKMIVVPRSGDVIASATQFYNAVKEGKVTHYPQQEFAEVVTRCAKRPIGSNGGWGWAGTEGADPTMLEAASLAYWGVMTTNRDPDRKMRVGVV